MAQGLKLMVLYLRAEMASFAYHRLSNFLLSTTAKPFITIKKANKAKVAAEVRSTKARSGLCAHKYIWTGRTVAGSLMPVGISTNYLPFTCGIHYQLAGILP